MNTVNYGDTFRYGMANKKTFTMILTAFVYLCVYNIIRTCRIVIRVLCTYILKSMYEQYYSSFLYFHGVSTEVNTMAPTDLTSNECPRKATYLSRGVAGHVNLVLDANVVGEEWLIPVHHS